LCFLHNSPQNTVNHHSLGIILSVRTSEIPIHCCLHKFEREEHLNLKSSTYFQTHQNFLEKLFETTKRETKISTRIIHNSNPWTEIRSPDPPNGQTCLVLSHLLMQWKWKAWLQTPDQHPHEEKPCQQA
jgi:hypothetical protein